VLLICVLLVPSAISIPGVVRSAEEPRESPRLLTPTLSSDPKPGSTLGAVGGNTFDLDEISRPSTIMAAGSSHRTTRSVPMASCGISSSRSAWWASIPTASARSWSTTAATACAVPPGVSASSFTTSPAARVSGRDESFASVSADYTRYLPFGDGNILAPQVHGRWTDDAPLGG
jgi:hypothetical protein